jgi:DNA polymerase III epsilon subunit-like protein
MTSFEPVEPGANGKHRLANGSDPGPERPHQQQRRRRYGRRRGGRIAVGDRFLARLGPVSGEPFAGIDDPDDGAVLPRPTPETPIDELRFVALDCETTGQSPHRLVELGAVAFTTETHLMSFETLVHSNDRINPFARRIHGIAAESLGGAPPVERVLARFRRFAQGAVLVEHSADAFDTRLIARSTAGTLEADNVDTTRLAAKVWNLRDTIGLEKLCSTLGIQHRRPHHALADAEATAACFLALVRMGRERFGWGTLKDLLDVGQPPQLRLLMDEALAASKETISGQVPARRRRNGRRRRAPAKPLSE